MIRIAIAEDEAESSTLLQSYLTQYAAARGCGIRTEVFRSGEELIRDYQPAYDIILMDIQMQPVDGMTAAEVIRTQDPEVLLIFITQAPQYAIRGYAVDALDYVLKPVNYFAFSQRMDRALERLQNRTEHYVMLPVKGGARKVEVSRIRYIESRGHTMILHMDSGEAEAGGTMTEMEKTLAPYGFSRCNKGYLLNLRHVDAVRDGCAVLGEDSLLISRGRRSSFLEDLTNYVGGRTK